MTISELPPRVSEYIGSYFATLKTITIASRFKLPSEKLPELASVIGDVFLLELKPADLPSRLKETFKMDSGTSFLLAAEIANQHFFAFQDFLGQVEELAKQWGVWGREFGGKAPAKELAPHIERMKALAGRTQGPTLEMNAIVNERKPAKVASNKLSSRTRSTINSNGVVLGGVRKISKPKPEAAVASDSPVKSINQTPKKLPSAKQPAVTRATAQSSAPGVSREQFLKQLEGFKIESLRSAGQSASLKISQLDQQLGTVLAGAPQDRPKVQNALRRSPLMALYQEQGQESIRSGKPLDHVIYERYQSGKPYLLKDEFDALAKLVKSLQ